MSEEQSGDSQQAEGGGGHNPWSNQHRYFETRWVHRRCG